MIGRVIVSCRTVMGMHVHIVVCEVAALDVAPADRSSGSSSRSVRCPSNSRSPRWVFGHLLSESYKIVSEPPPNILQS
jgi:hypothetical protein